MLPQQFKLVTVNSFETLFLFFLFMTSNILDIRINGWTYNDRLYLEKTPKTADVEIDCDIASDLTSYIQHNT